MQRATCNASCNVQRATKMQRATSNQDATCNEHACMQHAARSVTPPCGPHLDVRREEARRAHLHAARHRARHGRCARRELHASPAPLFPLSALFAIITGRYLRNSDHRRSLQPPVLLGSSVAANEANADRQRQQRLRIANARRDTIRRRRRRRGTSRHAELPALHSVRHAAAVARERARMRPLSWSDGFRAEVSGAEVSGGSFRRGSFRRACTIPRVPSTSTAVTEAVPAPKLQA